MYPMAQGSFSAEVVLRMLKPAPPEQQPKNSYLGRKKEGVGRAWSICESGGTLGKKVTKVG